MIAPPSLEPTKEEIERAKEAQVSPFIKPLWNTVSAFFAEMFKNVWTGLIEIVPEMVVYGYEKLTKLVDPPTRESLEWCYKYIEDLGVVDKDDTASLRKAIELPWPFNSVVSFFVILIFIGGYMTTKMAAMLGTLRQDLNKIHSPMPPGINEILNTAFIAPEKTGEVRDAMQRGGLSDEDIDLIFIGAYRLYNEEIVRTLYLRGVLNDDQMFMRMRELGYTDTRIKEIAQSWPVIPGPADLLTMVAKEAFEPDAIRLMGLADEFPEEQVSWLEKQGLSRDWVLKYWFAHWDQPSIMQGFEMLHRGVIGLKELDILFRTVEIPPFWREKLTKIAYMPYTRVDVRRMHKLGILDDEELIKSYKDLGYDDEHALNMAKFTVQYNFETQKELSMAQVLTGFREKLIDKEDAIDLLGQLGYTEDQAKYLTAFEEYKELKGYQDKIVKNIGDRYTANYISGFEARKRLNNLNLPSKKVDLLMDTWEIDRFEEVKMPSKADLDKFFINFIIDADTYTDEMRKLGYGRTYIPWYLELTKRKRKGKAKS